ncbi:hypothetical protein [Paracoccus aminophilus]|uniref:Uncharacterized protein n=1 Tax=Paracoccus aminophilus JCM 7686 TaxID=1367847 RepID=S5Y0S6_PARAH|nr:hypothetical protein [Paracoccus aminophilus]AGT09325.1 hypothetical protein JCM7686_2931 [Paracoccus aminophilus JCM 7686]AGT10568.1 hypothetical protein JCM7686_2252 [Paracoccus aminophilus JCM 7686]
MNSEEQAQGEKRVLRLLVEPLKRRGLTKTSTLTVAQFDEMIEGMCQKLAYMSDASLMALEEQAAANPSGKDRDRFPIANLILQWAAVIQPPDGGASPLIQAVFAHGVGQSAITEGWAPELLDHLRKNRNWPNNWTLGKIRDGADGALRRYRDLQGRLAREGELGPVDCDWWDRRNAALQRCREIGEGAAA